MHAIFTHTARAPVLVGFWFMIWSVHVGPKVNRVMPKRGKVAGKKTFCLLRWIEDETVSVLPATSANTGHKVYPGVYCEFKWLS